jgi:Immunity protein 49
MTRQELIDALNEIGLSRSAYSFDAWETGVNVLTQINGTWSWTVDERGHVSTIAQFESESDLYEHFLFKMRQRIDQERKSASMSEDDLDALLVKNAEEVAKKKQLEHQNSISIKDQPDSNWRDRLIPWHFADSELDETIQWAQEQAPHSAEMQQLCLDREALAIDTDRLRSLLKHALENAIVSFIANPHFEQLYIDLGLGVYAGAQLCIAYANFQEGEHYQIDWLMGETLQATRSKIDAQALPTYFEKSIQLAFICRNNGALNALSKLPIEIITNTGDSSTPPYLDFMLNAFQAYWRADIESAREYAASAYQWIIANSETMRARSEQLTWREDFHISVTSYNAELFKLAISLDTTSVQFNSKLTEALWSFRDCMLRNENLYNDWNYYFSFGALASASIAWDRGLEVEVISDYLPEFLYKGSYAKKKLEIPNLISK